jgi:hypothetical protein
MLGNVECSQFGGLHIGGEKPDADGFICGLNPPKPLYQVSFNLFITLHYKFNIYLLIFVWNCKLIETGIEH